MEMVRLAARLKACPDENLAFHKGSKRAPAGF